MATIAAITIGQSPRDDLMPELEAALGRKARILQRGALDGLGREEVRDLAPREGDRVLVTRLRDGTEVKVAERAVIGRLKACVAEMDRQEVDLIVLLCTGEFPQLVARTLLPCGPAATLAAVVPLPDQVQALGGRWARVCGPGIRVLVDQVSPYTGTDTDYEAAAARLRSHNPDLIVLDCIGFPQRARAIFRQVTGKPVILPRSLLGRVAGELIA